MRHSNPRLIRVGGSTYRSPVVTPSTANASPTPTSVATPSNHAATNPPFLIIIPPVSIFSKRPTLLKQLLPSESPSAARDAATNHAFASRGPESLRPFAAVRRSHQVVDKRAKQVAPTC